MSQSISNHKLEIANISHSTALPAAKFIILNNNEILKICFSYTSRIDMVATTQVNKVWNKKAQPIVYNNASQELLKMRNVLINARFLVEGFTFRKINTEEDFEYSLNEVAKRIVKDISEPLRAQLYEEITNSQPMNSTITKAFLGTGVAYVEKLDILVTCHLIHSGLYSWRLSTSITNRFEYYMKKGNLSMAQFAAEYHPQAIEKISFMIQIAIKLVEKHEIIDAVRLYKKYINEDIYSQSYRIVFTKHLEFFAGLERQGCVNAFVEIFRAQSEIAVYQGINYVKPLTAILILEAVYPIQKHLSKRILECYIKCTAKLIAEGQALMAFEILKKLEDSGFSSKSSFNFLRSHFLPRLIKKNKNRIHLLSQIPKHAYKDKLIEEIAKLFVGDREKFLSMVKLVENPKKRYELLRYFLRHNYYYNGVKFAQGSKIVTEIEKEIQSAKDDICTWQATQLKNGVVTKVTNNSKQMSEILHNLQTTLQTTRQAAYAIENPIQREEALKKIATLNVKYKTKIEEEISRRTAQEK